jgi:hypothetical protein
MGHHASEDARSIDQLDCINMWVRCIEIGSSLDVVQGGETGARLTLVRSNCSVVGGEDWILEDVSCCNESCEIRFVQLKLRESFVR